MAEVKDLCVRARPPSEVDLWDDVFGGYTHQLRPLPAPLPALRFAETDLQLSCNRIASCLQVNALLAAHKANRDNFRRTFGLDEAPAEQQYVVNLTKPAEGHYLADYLGICDQQVITLKTGNKIRFEGATFSRLRLESSQLHTMRKRVADHEALTHMKGGSLTVLGHFRRDKEKRVQCSFFRAEELLSLFGAECRPRVLNLFSCGSEPFARECAKLLAPHRVTINYVLEGEEVNLLELDPQPPHDDQEALKSFLYYGGPDVTKHGNRGKLFGRDQSDAFRFFRSLDVGQDT